MNSFERRRTTNYLVVCSSGTGEQDDIGLREINRRHQQIGFLCVGYHRIIRRDGSIERGRGLDQVGACVRGYNREAVGICLVGGGHDDDPAQAVANYTPAQYGALVRVLCELKQEYPSAKIVGLSDLLPEKVSPAFDVQRWVKENLPAHVL